MDKNTQTAYRQNLKVMILNVAMQEFYSNGIRNVKMDDIARKLQISKRTLYEIHGNKEELLLEGLMRDEARFESQLQQFTQSKKRNVMEVVMKFFQMQMKRLSQVNPCFFVELHKYDLIVSFLEKIHKERNVRSVLFFKTGVEEGLFRNDLDYELISRLCEEMTRNVMEKELYRLYDLQHIFRNIIIVFVRGFATKEGIAVIDKFLEQEGRQAEVVL